MSASTLSLFFSQDSQGEKGSETEKERGTNLACCPLTLAAPLNSETILLNAVWVSGGVAEPTRHCNDCHIDKQPPPLARPPTVTMTMHFDFGRGFMTGELRTWHSRYNRSPPCLPVGFGWRVDEGYSLIRMTNSYSRLSSSLSLPLLSLHF